jgi:hypothetical protein
MSCAIAPPLTRLPMWDMHVLVKRIAQPRGVCFDFIVTFVIDNWWKASFRTTARGKIGDAATTHT